MISTGVCTGSNCFYLRPSTIDQAEFARAEKICIRAYNYLAGHIMAKKEDDYEKARCMRLALSKEHAVKRAKKGTAPPSEDPRTPIAPLLPTPAVAGAEVSVVEMMNWCMLWHVSSVKDMAFAATDTVVGVCSTEDVPHSVVQQRAATKRRFEFIRRHVEHAISPIDRVIDVPTRAYYYDQRERAEDLENQVGWIQRMTIQKCADQHDTRRFFAAGLSAEVAGTPTRDMPEMLLWMHHFNRLLGLKPEFDVKWGIEMGLANSAVGKVRFDLESALPAEAHEKLAQMMLRGKLMANGKGPSSVLPAFAMSEFQSEGSTVHAFGGSELCVYADGNRKFKADHHKKTVFNLPDICNSVDLPGRPRYRFRCRLGDGATNWACELDRMIQREVKAGFATEHKDEDGRMTYRFNKRSVMVVVDTGNDMNKAARSDEISSWGEWKKWKQWWKVARDERTSEEFQEHTDTA